MQETGTYNQQFLRPYVTSFDGVTTDNLTERIINSGGGQLDPSVLSGLTDTFIKPSPQPESIIPIANGWNERRIRFLMEVQCDYQTGGTTKSYIQGYTNFPGVTATQAIAQDMDFYINSIVTTKQSMEFTPYGKKAVENIADNSHVLSSNVWHGVNQPGQQQLMRPQDVFCHMSNSHLPGMFDSDKSSVLDGRTILRTDAVKSNRTNGLPSNYATKIIDGYMSGASVAGYDKSEMDILKRSRQEVAELRASEDPFLAALASITLNGMTNHFRYSDLMKIDPNVDNVTNYAVMGSTQKATAHEAGQTADWHGSDILTVSATSLSQSVPALMMELMLTRLVFKSTNHDIQGKINTVIIDARSFSNAELGSLLNVFKTRLISEIINNITFNNHVSFMLDMRVDLLGETWIEISIDNHAPVLFVTPSFCDNLFVPVITSSPATIQNLTNDFAGLVSNVRENMVNVNNGGLNLSSKV